MVVILSGKNIWAYLFFLWIKKNHEILHSEQTLPSLSLSCSLPLSLSLTLSLSLSLSVLYILTSSSLSFSVSLFLLFYALFQSFSNLSAPPLSFSFYFSTLSPSVPSLFLSISELVFFFSFSHLPTFSHSPLVLFISVCLSVSLSLFPSAYLLSNTLGKGMNPIILPPAMGK